MVVILAIELMRRMTGLGNQPYDPKGVFLP